MILGQGNFNRWRYYQVGNRPILCLGGLVNNSSCRVLEVILTSNIGESSLGNLEPSRTSSKSVIIAKFHRLFTIADVSGRISNFLKICNHWSLHFDTRISTYWIKSEHSHTLWLASITSLEPLVKVCRQIAWTVDPAATLITLLVAVVGFGPPLQAISLEVTSVIGWSERLEWSSRKRIRKLWRHSPHRTMELWYHRPPLIKLVGFICNLQEYLPLVVPPDVSWTKIACEEAKRSSDAKKMIIGSFIFVMLLSQCTIYDKIAMFIASSK